MKPNSISRRAYRCHDSQTGACVCFTDTNYDSDLLLCISFLFARQRLVEQLSKIWNNDEKIWSDNEYGVVVLFIFLNILQ